MQRTVEAVAQHDGSIRILDPLSLRPGERVLVTPLADDAVVDLALVRERPLPDEHPVVALEERLRQAMLASDADQLGVLIADDLVFTTLTGEVVGKAADLDAHRSGRLRLTMLDPSDRRIVATENVAVVSVRMDVAGTYEGVPFSGPYRYTRVWSLREDRWRVVAGHMSALPARSRA